MGYIGYSMSENAALAYSCGEKPLTKWTKKEILKILGEKFSVKPEHMELFRKMRLEDLKNKLLICSSWHHTSKFYNRTDFYSVDYNENKKYAITTEQKEPTQEKEVLVYAKYLEWSGSRRHPRAKEHESYGVIKGNWFYFLDGGTLRKKKTDSTGFHVIREL